MPPAPKIESPATRMSSTPVKMTTRHIICLPTFGSPYLIASVKKSNTSEMLKACQKAVAGDICAFERKDFRLHPMFCEENARWRMAQQMLTYAQTKVYVNEDGANTMSPNMATIITNTKRRLGGCPHLFGNICLSVPDTFFQVVGFRPETFALVEKNFEPEDEAEIETKKAECLTKGWDYNEHNGMIYQSVV